MSEGGKEDRRIYFHLPPDTAYQAAVGVVSVRHGHLEYMVKMLIKALNDFSVEGALKDTAYQTGKRLRSRVLRDGERRFGKGEVLNSLTSLIGRCEMLSDRRNAVIHGLFGFELDGGPVISTDEGEWADSPTIDELHVLASELAALKDEII